ncbi:PLP-dependent aminotransferase family protein [[Clostridium] scindens]|uniref:MocR-like pyridoxine biosynthesis transcription factor PdxR n=1 Tax=Clostridium scindens (strain JCM 10418 / VPI 12708) TaxID=29347 RepID=UPI00298C2D44|nr:PLP-dependent aminotransferase family protein [[Clostridium] scindens]WPB18978.1 HTH-type transcriptional regulatory protein GabR [[Clostridium] scindens]
MNELTISLDTRSRIPLYEQIYDYIKTDIQSGRIPYGEKLPSTRFLSKHLEVSRSTVELAYEQLLSEGYIESVPYKGFFVARIDELYHLKKDKPQPQRERKEARRYRYDFTPNGVDLKSFPYNVWRKLSKDILMDDRTELFRSGDSQGEYGFRSAICSYLYQARGVDCTPDQIIVGAGSDYILMLLGMILGMDHTIAFEDPTYKQAYRMAGGMSYNCIPVSMDKNGMKVTELEKSGADIAYVTPSHQYPTGVIMPIRRRMELLKWACEAQGRYIVEDDYDSEFRYKGKPIPALKGYDASEKVIYLGTFSKSIAPAIRLSYMVLPKPLQEAYEQKARFVNSTVSKVDQLIVQKFIEEGYYERHLNKTRALYKSRHDVLIEELRPMADICTISGENAGVHLLLTFQNGMTEEELIDRAAREDIRVYGLSDYRIKENCKEKATILLGYANLTEEQIRKAARLLRDCWIE